MLNGVINLGTKIEIKVRLKNEIKLYLSEVEDIKDERNIVISAPIGEGKIVSLDINSKYEILFLTGALCYKTCMVVNKRIKEEEIYLLEVEIIDKLEKIQRRNYYRFKCLLHMKFIKLEDKSGKAKRKLDSDKKDEIEVYNAVVKDISGGGIRFICNTSIDKGEYIQSFIDLNGNDMNTICEILRKDAIINNEFYKFEYRTKFTNISERYRERIIKYIFDKQREDLKSKGKNNYMG